jgi:hypothetical protein
MYGLTDNYLKLVLPDVAAPGTLVECHLEKIIGHGLLLARPVNSF